MVAQVSCKPTVRWIEKRHLVFGGRLEKFRPPEQIGAGYVECPSGKRVISSRNPMPQLLEAGIKEAKYDLRAKGANLLPQGVTFRS
jgi:hypothetical protein